MQEFQFKPFEEMTEKDYAHIGFMSGLEVHQQLSTEKKLFCRCPVGKYSKNYDAEILRHMRPTLSELGEYDGTALMEFKTRKEIIYRIHHDSVCTYEMDDTPPFEINDEALDTSLGIGMLFDATIVDELHIIRKQYLDGSIPTGFQRTAIFCVDGKIPYKDNIIDIIQISIEEDSCREHSDIGHQIIWVADRLGTPLIEVVTAPQMKTPYEVADVCNIIRRAVRSTGLVRTGIGASREDVNVSVKGGTRIEIKGVSRIKNIPILTYNEAMRQWNLLCIKKELKNRGITPKTFEAKTKEITKQIGNTIYPPIHKAIKEKKLAKAVLLKGFKGILARQTQTNTSFSKEIADRVSVIACLNNSLNIIHSDSSDTTISPSEWKHIKQLIGATNKDTVVIVWGDEQDVETGVSEIIIRAKEATIGVPSETRQALIDNTTGFERILPGANRMYPDTDLPPKRITEKRLKKIKAEIPKGYWDKMRRYRKLNIPEDLVIPLSLSKYTSLFEDIVTMQNINPVLAAVVLIQFPKRLKKKGLNPAVLNEHIMKTIFQNYSKGLLLKDGIWEVMRKAAEKGVYSDKFIPYPCSDKELKNAIKEGEKKLININLYKQKNYEKVLMGLIMNKLRGRVNGKDVIKSIQLKGNKTTKATLQGC